MSKITFERKDLLVLGLVIILFIAVFLSTRVLANRSKDENLAPPKGQGPIADAKVIGYYAAWAAYSGFTPESLEVSGLTHINYAFANIGEDLKLTLGYPDIDIKNIQQLKKLREENPQLKLIISVGGWSWSGRFSDVALTESSRNNFADSAVDFILEHGFDGIDIDWEYPVSGGMASNVKRPQDKRNFTLLMKCLREKLEAQGAEDGKDYILSFAGGAGEDYLEKIELDKLQQYVDYINLMTYDMKGAWNKNTGFNAPLYSSDDTQQQRLNVDFSINQWLEAGVPAEKIVMGVPFYGYRFNGVSNVNKGVYQPHSGGGSISYASVAEKYLGAEGYIRYFNVEAMVPWLYNGSTFISYEDEASMKAKGEYIISKGLGGAMIWELSQDPNNVLLNSLHEGLQEK